VEKHKKAMDEWKKALSHQNKKKTTTKAVSHKMKAGKRDLLDA
jgi:hypothetical protein